MIVGGMPLDVAADGYGDAVLAAIGQAKGMGNTLVGARVFMFNYTVTDSNGVTLDGGSVKMRDMLQAARIAASNAVHAR